MRHGGAYYRVHPCQLMKVNYNEMNNVKSKVEGKSSKSILSEDRKSIKPQDLVYIEEDSDEEKGELRADGGDNDYDLNYVPNSTLNSNATKPKKNSFVKYML